MKRFFLILLAVLMLCGCAAAPQQEAPSAEPSATLTTEPSPGSVGSHNSDSATESQTGDALLVYPLSHSDATHILPMGDGILVFSGDANTTLTLLAGEELHVKATKALNCQILPNDPAVQASDKGVTYYDAGTRELVFLDAELKEGTRISLPDDMIGGPTLSANRKNLYYCTGNALRTIDLDTGLDMLLREMVTTDQRITGLHCSDMILACQATDAYGTLRTTYVSTENGRTLYETTDSIELTTQGSRYFARHWDGISPELLTGTINGAVFQMSYSSTKAAAYPVLDLQSVLLLTDNGQNGTVLEFCNLENGKRTSLLECATSIRPKSVIADADKDSLLMLCYDQTSECDTVYRWVLSRSTVTDDRNYVQPRHTADNPDLEAIAQIRTLANQLEQRHGVKLLYWTDATTESSANLILEPEYQPLAIEQWLKEIDQMLTIYPSGFLGQLAKKSGSPLRICLVRSFEAKDPDEDLSCLLHLDAAADPYIFVTMEDDWKTDLMHQLFHVIDTHVLTTSSAYDAWTSLNPKNFHYTFQYDAEPTSITLTYVASGTFVDIYATSFPKEDRAMTMLAALETGNETIFQSQVMQSKLKLLCDGIRDAFGYDKRPEVFLWEQYLK